MKKVKTMDCGYCPLEYCMPMETGGERDCLYVTFVPDDEDVDAQEAK